MAVKFNTDTAFELFQKKGGKTSFPDSLKQVLNWVQKDGNFTDPKQVAWLLGTAKVESDYALDRWESDYLCGDWKTENPDGKNPCKRALDYYRSTDGKANYYNLGTDERGLPFFGRGLIQLTGKSNYDLFGKKLGINLLKNADLARHPDTSYQIASTYFSMPKGGYNKTVNEYVMAGDFPMARKIVKGSSSGWENAKKEYDRWMDVFNEIGANVKKQMDAERKRALLQMGGFALIFGSLIGLAFIGYGVYKKKIKLI